MALPALIDGTPAGNWPSQRNARMGPFEVTSGGTHYLLTFSTTEAYKSADEGHTWEVADPANSVYQLTAGVPYPAVSVARSGDTFYLYVPRAGSATDVFPFDGATMTWGAVLSGPAVTWAAARNSYTDLHAWVRPSDSRHVLLAQVPTETVGSAFRRCALYHGTPGGAWTGPLYLSTGTATLPGVAQHHELQYGIEGASERYHLFWTEVSALKSRVFDATNTFGTTVTVAGVTHPSAGLLSPMGHGCAYEDSGTKLALMWGEGSGTGVGVQIIRVDSLTSDTAANWSVESVATDGGENGTSNCGAVMNDGDSRKLWVVRATDGVSNQSMLQYTDDGGAGDWQEFRTWRPERPIDLWGMSAMLLTGPDRIGYVYSDSFAVSDFNYFYDAVHIYQSKASKGAGTYTTDHDLGVGGVADYIIHKDSSIPAGVTSVITVKMREDEGVPWDRVEPFLTLSTDEGTDSRDEAHTGQTARFMRITEIVTGGTAESGVAGT